MAVNLLRKSFRLKRNTVPLLVPREEEPIDSIDFAEAFLKGKANYLLWSLTLNKLILQIAPLFYKGLLASS